MCKEWRAILAESHLARSNTEAACGMGAASMNVLKQDMTTFDGKRQHLYLQPVDHGSSMQFDRISDTYALQRRLEGEQQDAA